MKNKATEDSATYQPHLHCVLTLGKRVPVSQLRAEFKKLHARARKLDVRIHFRSTDSDALRLSP